MWAQTPSPSDAPQHLHARAHAHHGAGEGSVATLSSLLRSSSVHALSHTNSATGTDSTSGSTSGGRWHSQCSSSVETASFCGIPSESDWRPGGNQVRPRHARHPCRQQHATARANFAQARLECGEHFNADCLYSVLIRSLPVQRAQSFTAYTAFAQSFTAYASRSVVHCLVFTRPSQQASKLDDYTALRGHDR